MIQDQLGVAIGTQRARRAAGGRSASSPSLTARVHLPALSDIAQRTVVYVSENDSALRFAALLARASRLGRPRFDELTREDLETFASNERLVGIDVTGVYGPHELTGARGHGYWVANQRVSSDVLLSMVYPFDPAWRGLVHGPGLGMWT